MAQSVLVIADSGTGKSTSIRTLDPKETFIINIANKPLPFKGYKSKYTQISKENPKGNLTAASSAPGIIKAMKHVNDKMLDIKTIVVDDWHYVVYDRSCSRVLKANSVEHSVRSFSNSVKFVSKSWLKSSPF